MEISELIALAHDRAAAMPGTVVRLRLVNGGVEVELGNAAKVSSQVVEEETRAKIVAAARACVAGLSRSVFIPTSQIMARLATSNVFVSERCVANCLRDVAGIRKKRLTKQRGYFVSPDVGVNL